jgi:hypothetical protein
MDQEQVETPEMRTASAFRSGKTFTVAALVLLAGCLPDATPPEQNRAPPPSCGNRQCEPSREDCDICPEDCPCCAIIDSRNTTSTAATDDTALPERDPARVIGAPDQRSVVLDETTELTLSFGREVFDYFIEDAPDRVVQHVDFTLHGEVTSANAIERAGTCTGIEGAQREGVFAVLASPDGIEWSTIGIWARTTDGSQTSQFDLACAQLKQAKFVRLQASPGATASLDAVTAVIDGEGRACYENSEQ